MVYRLTFMALAAAGLVAHYWYTQNKIETLTGNISKYQVAVEQSKQTIDILEKQVINVEKQLNSLAKSFDEAEVQKKELLIKLRKHDLTNLAAKKPGLVEKRINDATKKLFSDFNNSTAF